MIKQTIDPVVAYCMHNFPVEALSQHVYSGEFENERKGLLVYIGKSWTVLEYNFGNFYNIFE